MPVFVFVFTTASLWSIHAAPPVLEPFWDQKGFVRAVTFTPDGKQLVLAGSVEEAGEVSFWALDTLTCVRRIETSREVTRMAIAPNGRMLILYEVGGRLVFPQLSVWDVSTGKLRTTIGGGISGGHFSISPDSKLIAVGQRGWVDFFDLNTGRNVGKLDGEGVSPLGPVVFSPNGKGVAAVVGSSGVVERWTLEDGRRLPSFTVRAQGAGSLGYASDGKMLLVGGDRYNDRPSDVFVLDSATGKLKGRWKGHRGEVRAIQLSGDGKLAVTAASSDSLRVWEVATGKLLLDLPAPSNLWSVALSSDGKALAAAGTWNDWAGRGNVRIWAVPSGRERLPASLAAKRDRRDAAIEKSTRAQAVARAARDASKWTLERSRRAEYALAIHQASESITKWEFDLARTVLDETPADLRGLEWHLLNARMPRLRPLGRAAGACFSPDGTLLALGTDTLQVLNVQTGKLQFKADIGGRAVSEVRYSPDGSLLAVADSSQLYGPQPVRVFDTRTGKAVALLKAHKSGVMGLAFSPDGRQLVSYCTDRLVIWDTTNWKAKHNWSDAEFVDRVAFSPDGKRLALGGHSLGKVEVREVATGKSVISLEDRDSSLGQLGLLFLSEGKALMARSKDQCVLFEVETGRVVRRIRHPDRSDGLTVAPDGRHFLAGWSLFDLETGQERAGIQKGRGDAPLRGQNHDLLAQALTRSGEVRMVVRSVEGASLVRFPLDEGRRQAQVGVGLLYNLSFSTDGASLLARNKQNVNKEEQQEFLQRCDSTTGEPLGRRVGLGAKLDGLTAEWLAVGAPFTPADAKEPAEVVATSPDARTVLLLEENGRACLAEVSTGRRLSVLEDRLPLRNGGRFTADGKGVLTWGYRADLVLWDARTGAERQRWAVPGLALAVRLTKDGTGPAHLLLKVNEDGEDTLVLWDVQLGERVAGLRGHVSAVEAAAFSEEGRILATLDQMGSVRLWDASTGHWRGVLRHQRGIWWEYLTIRPDGKALAVGSPLGPVYLWAGQPR